MTIYPLTFQLGPLTITGYGIMMMVAFLMAGWAIQVDLRRRRSTWIAQPAMRNATIIMMP